jgi:hypothetical protein
VRTSSEGNFACECQCLIFGGGRVLEEDGGPKLSSSCLGGMIPICLCVTRLRRLSMALLIFCVANDIRD